MTSEILGRREDQHLEFKSSEALNSPDKIARAVVGMLNADGGEIWIGVEEEDGKAAAVDPVPEAERAKGKLLDSLLDALDPSPTAGEVSIERVPSDAEPALLVVKVRPAEEPGGRKPYALRKGGAWYFFRRMGARNHPMSRQEIFGEPASRSGEPALDAAVKKLEEERQRFRDSGGTGLWVGLKPEREIPLDLENDLLGELAMDPSLTGNRRSGWHFARTSHPPKPTKTGIEWGLWSELLDRSVSRTEVHESGDLRFWTALERLHRQGEEREIWPLILLEYPISAFRIARVIYRDLLGPEDRVAADLALFGVGGWGLREGSPGDFFWGEDLHRLEDPDLHWEPVVFRFREIDEYPDRCGFRLVRRVYRAFGFREDAIPREYDRETGRLILPE